MEEGFRIKQRPLGLFAEQLGAIRVTTTQEQGKFMKTPMREGPSHWYLPGRLVGSLVRPLSEGVGFKGHRNRNTMLVTFRTAVES